jgi:hypothetical protein
MQRTMPDNTVPEPMSRWRLWMVNGIIAFLVLGHLYDIAKKATHWPFGQYEMFAKHGEKIGHDRMAIMGVTPDNQEFRISEPQHAAPLPSYHARLAFMKASWIGIPAKREKLLGRLCAEYLQRYEAHRKAGQFSGPPAQSMRLYNLHWNLMDPELKNVATPDEKQLIFDSGAPAAATANQRSGS